MFIENVDDFLKKTNYNLPSNLNLFQVEFSPPEKVINLFKKINGTDTHIENIKALCVSIEIPESNLNGVSTNNYYSSHHGNYLFTSKSIDNVNLPLEFLVFEKSLARAFFNTWKNYPIIGRGIVRYQNEYVSPKMVLTKYNKDKSIDYKVTLFNVAPHTVDSLKLNWNSKNTQESLPVTFKFDYLPKWEYYQGGDKPNKQPTFNDDENKINEGTDFYIEQ